MLVRYFLAILVAALLPLAAADVAQGTATFVVPTAGDASNTYGPVRWLSVFEGGQL